MSSTDQEEITLVSVIDYKRLTPKEFVGICADILEAEEFHEVRIIEGTGDWKEDIHADEFIHSQSGVYEVLHFKVQCKHYAKSGNTVKPAEVNEMFPYLFSTDANRLLIITDTDLTTQAKQEIESFNNKQPIKKVIYWTQREIDNRLLQHRWIINKYFPVVPQYFKNDKQLSTNPYKLLESYKEEDCESFFGRDNDINVLAEAVYRNRTIVLFGESGVGKTSLLNAGLFPRLRQEGWLIIPTRCLNTPVENIRRETVAQIERLPDRIDIGCLKENTAFDTFLENLTQISKHHSSKILLVLDQAEELFTLCDEIDRNALSIGISGSLNSFTNGICFLFCMRDDYLGDLRSWTRGKIALDKAFSWNGLHSIGRFTVEEARKAIEEPAKRLNLSYDKLLIEQLLSDLLQIGSGFVYQPYLQIVCSTLFDEVSKKSKGNENVITADIYQKLNSTTGIITSFFSEKLWIGFTEKEQLIARKVTQSLTTSEGLRHQLSIQDLEFSTSEKPSDIDGVLQRLIDKRLVHRLVIEGSTQPVFELIHDFLGKQIAYQLSDEEKRIKEAEELLVESLRRWKKHGTFLNDRELSILEQNKEKLKFNSESMRMIFSNINRSDASAYVSWFDRFGKDGIDIFITTYLESKLSFMYHFEEIVRKWDNETTCYFIDITLSSFSLDDADEKIERCFNLFTECEDERVLSDNRILQIAQQILVTRTDKNLVVRVLNLLMASKSGLDTLLSLGDKAIEIVIDVLPFSHFYGWYLRYDEVYQEIFLLITRKNVPYAIELLRNRIWTNIDARETESLVYTLSILSKNVELYKKILLEHWTAYARQSAASVLDEIGSEEAMVALIAGLSNRKNIVLKQILITLSRKGNSKALPALEKLSEDPQISESTLGYVHKTISKIRKREKIG